MSYAFCLLLNFLLFLIHFYTSTPLEVFSTISFLLVVTLRNINMYTYQSLNVNTIFTFFLNSKINLLLK